MYICMYCLNKGWYNNEGDRPKPKIVPFQMGLSLDETFGLDLLPHSWCLDNLPTRLSLPLPESPPYMGDHIGLGLMWFSFNFGFIYG